MLRTKEQTRRLILPQPAGPDVPIPARYGQKGSVVAIKEKWRVHKAEQSDPQARPTKLLVGYGDGQTAWKEAPPEAIIKYAHDGRWKPSRFMPRWASRLYVELVSDVEIQRLQDITAKDVREEGVPPHWAGWDGLGPEDMAPEAWDAMDWKEQWKAIWNPLHQKEGYGWEANPWVFRLSFRRIACPSPM
jgi:hypothetical protein